MTSWNKGLTKSTSKSLNKTSVTLSGKKKSNFWKWQRENRVNYAKLVYSEELAELYGNILGDGCIEKFPRTDKLTISFNRKEQDHLKKVEGLMRVIFKKDVKTRIRRSSACDDLYIYQQRISERLNFPYGRKLDHNLVIPSWIHKKEKYLRVCLKGLFESDGNWHVDERYKTNVIKFTNKSESLLNDIYCALIKLNYHPQRRELDVRLARKEEVKKFVNWIQFRKYSGIV